jgi:diguanylate cyclase (GGDEF)-like protein
MHKDIFHPQRGSFNLYGNVFGVLWTLGVGASLAWNIYTHQEVQVVNVATAQARTNIQKDLSIRRWATSHGGVYVPPTERTPPNPYLADVPKRDVVTTDGDALTLMNPAYMMREVMADYERDYGVQGHITGKLLLNPANAPDAWEAAALDRLAAGEAEVSERTTINGEPYMRMALPMWMEEGCLKCHAWTGIPVGGLRGTITTAVPLAPLHANARKGSVTIMLTHSALWMLGLGILGVGIHHARRKDEANVALRKESELRLRHQATHDPLTGLANRHLLDDRLRLAAARADRRDHKVGVVLMDIDHFKWVNDAQGHEFGDEVLRQFAERLQGQLRDEDTFARMGGDEFVALIECESAAEIASFCARVIDLLATPLTARDEQVFLTTSLGISLYPDDGDDTEALIRRADTALNRAKEQGRNAYQFFTDEMNVRAVERMMLESGIRGALEREEFFLAYQPQVDTATGQLLGVEALIRWNHTEMGMVPPISFIPIAEESDLIIRIGDWTLGEVCRQMRAWADAGIDVPQVSLNVSARQFKRADLGSQIVAALTAHGVPPERLCVEMTETALIAHANNAIGILDELVSIGVKVSLDDFGTGYSSLSYLKRFPIDEVKIDKSFIDDLTDDAGDLAITGAIIAMAHSLGMVLVAEGVETAEQRAILLEKGCDRSQGYYFARPMPPADLEQWISARRDT